MQKLIFKFLILFLFFSFSLLKTDLKAQPQEQLATADSLFNDGKYTQSYDIYEDLINQGLHSPAMLLKMAFISEGLKQYDDALYYLNLYYLLTADNGTLEKMEKLAKEQGITGFEATEKEFIATLYFKYYDQLLMITGGSDVFLLAFLFFLKVRRGVQKPYLAGILFVVVLASLYYFVNHGRYYNKAITTEGPVFVMKGPSPGADLIEVLGEGHRLSILDIEDVWVKVKWGEKTGYIKDIHLKSINFF
ncbi:MAG: hypothetical protein OEX02_02930 [Cyclobacteriaceae bacterium]|nr:hypothetical protein [Cyclobacteriaceae bacterium]